MGYGQRTLLPSLQAHATKSAKGSRLGSSCWSVASCHTAQKPRDAGSSARHALESTAWRPGTGHPPNALNQLVKPTLLGEVGHGGEVGAGLVVGHRRQLVPRGRANHLANHVELVHKVLACGALLCRSNRVRKQQSMQSHVELVHKALACRVRKWWEEGGMHCEQHADHAKLSKQHT